MTPKFVVASVVVLAGHLLTGAAAHAVPILNLYYDPGTGNVKLQNTTSSTQSFQSVDVITLGNGTVGAATPNSQGYLSQSAAALPAAAYIVNNTNPNGFNGLYSQVYAANVGSAVFTLQPYAGWNVSSPIGPVGSFLDLGNIAVTGMTQADLNTRFLTDPEGSPGGQGLFGSFLFSYQTAPSVFSSTTPGDVVAVVPEPSGAAMAGVALVIGGIVLRRHRRATCVA